MNAPPNEQFLTLQEIYQAAKRNLPPGPWAYLIGGAETETTVKRNRHALDTIAHCGSCDVACDAGQDCCEGACVPRGPGPAGSCGMGGECDVTCPEPCTCQAGECVDSMGLFCL